MRHTAQLLVVDDDRAMREMLASLFKERGLWVEEASSARAALELAAAHQRIHGIRKRHIAARDRGGARAAIGLQHVTVDRDRPLTDGVEIDAGPQ